MLLKRLFVFLFRVMGWRYSEDIPANLKSFVMVGGPHTSNWDFIPAMAAATLCRRNCRFVIKHNYTKAPFGFLFKALGAIGVDRELIKQGKVSSTTDLMAGLFDEYNELVLMIAPEGTRSPNENWKSGFYYIAKKANVPIVVGAMSYKQKHAYMTHVIDAPNMSLNEVMKEINKIFSEADGKIPHKFRPALINEEA